MIGLIRAEYRKLKSTQTWFWLLLACVALTALLVIVQLATRDDLGTNTEAVRDVFTSAYTAYVPAFVLGILAVTTEFRYQTITPTLLATPSRWRLITAKLISYALVGLVYAVACLVVALAIAVPWLGSKHDVNASFGQHNVWTALLGIAVIVTLYGLVGLGWGAFVRNQIVAVSVGLIYILIVEGLLQLIPYVRNAYKFLPGAGAQAIIQPHAPYGPNEQYQLLGVWGGVAVLVVWALGLSVLGAGWTMNKDIT
jgi:ABC-2 type transport system permease protein